MYKKSCTPKRVDFDTKSNIKINRSKNYIVRSDKTVSSFEDKTDNSKMTFRYSKEIVERSSEAVE